MVPDYLDIEAWNGFCEMRKMKGSRAPFTEYAKKLILRKLEDFYRQGYDPNHILETAVERGWSGVFLTNDTPRRQLKAEERQNVAKVMQMVAKVGR